MANGDELVEIVERVKAGVASQEDYWLLHRAIQAGTIVLATGERSVSAGVVSHSIVSTGDNTRNLLINDVDASIVQNVLNSLFAMQIGSAPSVPEIFIGREEAVNDLKIRLGIGTADGFLHIPVQVMTAVRGWPGVGKTSLTAALAHDEEVVRAFPDGVLWVSLGMKPSVLSELAAWGRALQLESIQYAKSVKEAKALLSAFMRQKKALIIVDDVWEAAHGDAFKIGGLACATLFTTRSSEVARALAATPDDIYWLPVLTPRKAWDLLRAIAPSVTDMYPEACNKLIDKLGALPLALRVAGGLLEEEGPDGLKVEDLLHDLQQGVPLLKSIVPADMSDLATQSTPEIAVLLRKSISQMSTEDRKRFRFLGSFPAEPATFDLEALAYVWHVSTTVAYDTVRQFKRRGLLEPSPSGRYRTHALLAILAQSELQETVQEVQVSGNLHFDFFLALANKAQSKLKGAEQRDWLDRLEMEHSNYRKALQWAREQRNIENALRLGGALYQFWHLHGHIREGREFLEPLVNESRATDHPSERAEALHCLGILVWAATDYVTATFYLEECLSLRSQLGDKRGSGLTLNNLGLLAEAQEQYDKAETLYKQCIKQLRAIHDMTTCSAPLGNLARLSALKGDLAQAHTYNEEAYAIRASSSNDRGLADSLQIRGDISYLRDNFDVALSNYLLSYEKFRCVGNKLGLAQSLERFASIEIKYHRLDKAACMLGASHSLRKRIGWPLSPSEAHWYDRILGPHMVSTLQGSFEKDWRKGEVMEINQIPSYIQQTISQREEPSDSTEAF